MSKCIQEKFVPKGLEITLEPTIGNFDQVFVDNWYTDLKQFSIVLLKQIVVYYDKTEQKTQKNINEAQTILNQQLNKEDYEEIKNTIISNETATKKLLRKRKFKKFLSWKYKPKSAVKTVVNNNEGSRKTEEQPRPTKPSYAQALNSNTNTYKKYENSKFNKPPRKQTQEKHKWKIKITQPSKSKPKQEIIRSRNNSKTNLTSDYKYQQEIKQFKEEIKLLKLTKENHQE